MMSYPNVFSIEIGILDADWSILKVSNMDQSVLHIKGMVLQLLYYQSWSVLFCVVLFRSLFFSYREKLPYTQPVHQADVPAIPHCREEPISHDRQSQETETMSSETKNGGSSLDRPPLLASAAAVTGHTLDPDISPLAAYQSDQTDMMTGTDKRVTERQTDDDTSPAAYQSHDNHLLINVTQNTEPQLIEAAANGKDSGVPADQNDNPITHKHAEIEQLTHYSSTYYNSALITIGGQQL